MATYISMFNEYASQVDWNESSLVARFRTGLKDEILDSMSLTQPCRLQEWMVMASHINEWLQDRRKTRQSVTNSSHVKASILPS